MEEKTPILLLEKKATLLLSSKYPCTLFTTPTRPCHSVSQSDFKGHSSEMSSAVCCKRSTVGWRKTGNVYVGLDNDFCFCEGCNETVRLFRKGSRVEVVQELLSQYLSGRFLCKMSLQKHVSTLEMNVLSHEQKNICFAVFNKIVKFHLHIIKLVA